MAEQSGSLAWNISGPSLTKFLSSPNGAEFTSETFNAGSFTFQCKVYPNGRKKEQKGCVMLYFVLQSSLTNQISKITVKARLYCPQTLCDWKHIQHLKKDNAGIGWHSQNMLLSEAQQHSHLKFLCQITILRIEYQSSPKAGLDTSSLGVNIYHKLSKMNVSTVHQWEMNRKLLDSFRAAHCGKFYHSMDYNWDSFCTSVAPNGGNVRDAGNVKCGIQLLQLPAGIGKIKCKFSICCNVGNLQCDGKKEFSYNSTFIAWGDGTLTTQDLLNTTGTVHFRVTITITKCFDEFHHEIARSSWHKYGVINHKEDGNRTQNVNAKKKSLDPLDTVGIGGTDTPSHLDPSVHTKDLFLSLSQNRDRDPVRSDRGRSNVVSPNHSNSRSNMVTKPRGASVPRLDSEEHHRIRTQITNRRAPPVPPPRPQQNGVVATAATTGLIGGTALQSSNVNKSQRPQPSRSRAKSKATVLDRKQKSPLKRQYTEGIRANESKIDAQSRNLQDIVERIDLMESHRSEDREYLVEVEENVMNLQKSQHRIQQQQFAMLKECIHELQATVQRLSHELVRSRNRMDKLEKDRGPTSRDEEDHFEMKEGDRKSPTKLKVKKSNDASKSTAFRLKSSSRRSQKNAKRAVAVSSALAMWLSHDCGFPQYIGCFVSNGYDRLEIIKEMTRAELDEIGITLKGHQFKIAKEIEKLQHQQKHHRAARRPFVANGDRDGGHFDLEHVATFLTPADSPALPHSPMFTLPARRGRVNSVPMLSPSAKEQSPSMYSHSKLFLNLDASQHGNHALHQSNPLHTAPYQGDSGKGDGGTTGKHGDDDGLPVPDLKDRDEPKTSTARWAKPKRAQAVHSPFGGGGGVRGPTVTANMNMNVNVNMSPTDSTSSYTATATGTTEFGPNKRFLLDSPRRSHGPNRYPFSNQTRQRHLQLLDMWECGQCQNHNLGTLWKCEFCGRER